MAIDERSRHQLFKRLEDTLGEEHATVLMEHLPPVGWADVATKRDLEELEARLVTRFDSRFETIESRFEVMDSRFEAMDSRFEAMGSRFEARPEAKLGAQTRTMVQWFMFGTMATLLAIAALAFTAARLV